GGLPRPLRRGCPRRPPTEPPASPPSPSRRRASGAPCSCPCSCSCSCTTRARAGEELPRTVCASDRSVRRLPPRPSDLDLDSELDRARGRDLVERAGTRLVPPHPREEPLAPARHGAPLLRRDDGVASQDVTDRERVDLLAV